MMFNFDNSYARLPEHWFERTEPTPLNDTQLISFNASLADLLGLESNELSADALVKALGANQLPEGAQPLAMKYTGHQFGSYNPDLGDGRGLLLGEHVAPNGQRWDIHLKGAGKTAYSRFGDGRAVLRSSIREYLVSEAMHGLGIPTTRALCLLGSEQRTYREGMERCALLLRVTPCHVRFGHFEYFFYSGQHDDLRRLAKYVIERYYPALVEHQTPYLELFREVMKRSANLVALWQAYGFVHAVMNTDNMSIIGETFDYGPFTFMDRYDPSHIANKNDERGRYAFRNQPSMMQWNLAALAQAMLPLVEPDQLEAELDRFSSLYERAYYTRLAQRLGFEQYEHSDKALIDGFLAQLERGKGDLNRSLYWLMQQTEVGLRLDESMGNSPEMPAVLKELFTRRARNNWDARKGDCALLNPVYILRNYMAEEAIRDAEYGGYQRVNDLLALLANPFAINEPLAQYAGAPPNWAEAICLTCSS